MKNKENVVLIGMPAAGKSTVGVLLAKKLGYDFLDTDILIQSKEQKTLAQLIEAHGPEGFLRIEEKHVKSVCRRRHVIATGGSVVYRPEAVAHLSENGILVYLFVDLPTLKTRLVDVVGRGVAMAPHKAVDDLYKERTPLYDAVADITVECNTMNPARVTAAVLAGLPG